MTTDRRCVLRLFDIDTVNKRTHKNSKITTDQFIEYSRSIYGENTFDYSLTVYTSSKALVKLICPTHGETMMTANNHLYYGSGCKECKRIELFSKKFVKMANQIHNEKYSYDLANYVNSLDKVIIICPKHGQFKQRTAAHLAAHGCPACARDIVDKKNTLTYEQFVKRSNKVHNNKYDYSLVQYIKATHKVIIICPKHGPFKQEPASHWKGCGCPKCHLKKQPLLHGYIQLVSRRIFQYNNRSVLAGKELDMYNVRSKLAIEYDGEDHYITVKRNPKWADKEALERLNKRQMLDKEKNKECIQKQINLIRWKYTVPVTRENVKKVWKHYRENIENIRKGSVLEINEETIDLIK